MMRENDGRKRLWENGWVTHNEHRARVKRYHRFKIDGRGSEKL